VRQVVALVLRGLHRFAADTSKMIDVDASSVSTGLSSWGGLLVLLKAPVWENGSWMSGRQRSRAGLSAKWWAARVSAVSC